MEMTDHVPSPLPSTVTSSNMSQDGTSATNKQASSPRSTTTRAAMVGETSMFQGGGDMATQKVFKTAELTETILIQLPVKDLLFAQRVCKTWKNCIDRSSKLQKGLFMEPVGELVATSAGVQKDASIESALKRIAFSKHAIAIPSIAYAFRNPLLEILPWSIMGLMIAGELDESVLPPNWRYPSASWRRMLVTQPSVPVFTPPEKVASSQGSLQHWMTGGAGTGNGERLPFSHMSRKEPSRSKFLRVRRRHIDVELRSLRYAPDLSHLQERLSTIARETKRTKETMEKDGLTHGKKVEDLQRLQEMPQSLSRQYDNNRLKAFCLAIEDVVDKARTCITAAEIEQIDEEYRQDAHHDRESEPRWFAFP